jgi:hypothetical protein
MKVFVKVEMKMDWPNDSCMTNQRSKNIPKTRCSLGQFTSELANPLRFSESAKAGCSVPAYAAPPIGEAANQTISIPIFIPPINLLFHFTINNQLATKQRMHGGKFHLPS